MGFSLADLFVRLTADTSDFKAPIEDAAKRLEALEGSVSSLAEKGGDSFSKFAQTIIGRQTQADEALKRAQSTFEELLAAYERGTVSAEVLARAQLDLERATARANVELQHHKETVEESEKGLAIMAEQLLKFGEALAITEALKEFGEEALKAFGFTEKAEISLAALTGDALEAKEAIEKLKEFSVEGALDFHSLVGAQQSMTAFGISAEQIPAAMLAIANAAASVGKDFDSVEAGFERAAETGNASAKILRAFGLTLDDLGATLGVTSDKVKEAFKSLDQDERVRALIETLEKFEGVNEKVAAGIEGQWKNIKTQAEFVFDALGEALAPVVSQILQVLNTDVLPFLRALVEGFNDLPIPVKDAAVALGLIVASIAPLATGLAGFGLAMNGLTAALPALNGMLQALGVASEGAALSIGAMGAALGLIAVPAAAFGAALFATLQQIDQAKDRYDAFTSSVRNKDILQGISEGWSVEDLKEYGYTLEQIKTATEGKALGPKFEFNDDYGFAVTVPKPEGSGGGHEETIAEIVARKAAAKEALAAYQEMVDAETGFHNSVVDLYNTFPATYEQYVAKLDDGGKKATATLGEITNAINKAVSLSENMAGKPLDDLVDWVVALTKLQDKARDFAAQDAFNTAALKIAALVDKFPKQADEISNLDSTLGALITDMAAAAATVPEHFLDSLDASTIVKNLLESQKQLDDQLQKSGQTFTKAWEAYETGARKAAGITTPLQATFSELNIISTDLKDRLPAPLYGLYQATTLARGDLELLRVQVDQIGVAMPKSIAVLNDLFTRMDQGAKVSLSAVELAVGSVVKDLDRWAKFNPGAAAHEYDAIIARLVQMGAAYGTILNLQQGWLTDQIRLKTLTGDNATAEIIQLENVRIEQQKLIDQSTNLGNVYVGLMNNFHQLWGSLTKGIADNLIEWKDWSDTLTKIFEDFGKRALETLLKGFFTPLEDKLTSFEEKAAKAITNGLGSVLSKVGLGGGGVPKIPSIPHGGVGGVGSGSGEVPVEGIGGPGGLPGDFGGEAGVPDEVGGITQGGGAGGSLGGLLGSLGSIGSLVGGIAAVGSGITQGIQMERLINLTGEIEISTRQAKEQLVGGIQTALNTYLPELKHLADIWGELVQGTLAQIRDILWYGVVHVSTESLPGNVGSNASQQITVTDQAIALYKGILADLDAIRDAIRNDLFAKLDLWSAAELDKLDAIEKAIEAAGIGGGLGGGGTSDLLDALSKSNEQIANLAVAISELATMIKTGSAAGGGESGVPVVETGGGAETGEIITTPAGGEEPVAQRFVTNAAHLSRLAGANSESLAGPIQPPGSPMTAHQFELMGAPGQFFSKEAYNTFLALVSGGKYNSLSDSETDQLKDFVERAVGAAHPAEYAAAQRKPGEDEYLAKYREALLGGTNEYSFQPGAGAPSEFHGPSDVALGGPLPTLEDALQYFSSIPYQTGVKPIGDPLAQAKRDGITDLVSAEMLKNLSGQAQSIFGPNATPAQEQILKNYLSGTIDLTTYQKSIADILVDQQRALMLQNDAINDSTAATKQNVPVLSAYQQALQTQFEQAKSAQAQVNQLQSQFYQQFNQESLLSLAHQVGGAQALQTFANASGALGQRVIDSRVPGGVGLAPGGVAGIQLPQFSDSELNTRAANADQWVGIVNQARDQQAQNNQAMLAQRTLDTSAAGGRLLGSDAQQRISTLLGLGETPEWKEAVNESAIAAAGGASGPHALTGFVNLIKDAGAFQSYMQGLQDQQRTRDSQLIRNSFMKTVSVGAPPYTGWNTSSGFTTRNLGGGLSEFLGLGVPNFSAPGFNFGAGAAPLDFSAMMGGSYIPNPASMLQSLAGAGGFYPIAMVTVNAVNTDSKTIAKGLVGALIDEGIKLR